MSVPSWAILLAAYLLGAFPTAHLMARRAGVDLRRMGDGNLGARNAYLHLGPTAGISISLLDVLKGMAAALLACTLAPTGVVMYLAGFAAALGHNYSPFIGFRGGQGMATGLGVLAVFQPQETLIATAVAWLVYGLSRRWDLSWTVGLFLLPVSGLALGRPIQQVAFACLQLLIVGIKKMLDTPHRRRLRRLR